MKKLLKGENYVTIFEDFVLGYLDGQNLQGTQVNGRSHHEEDLLCLLKKKDEREATIFTEKIEG